MPKKTFTSGSVLSAGDLNTFLMDQSVPTFATTTDRNTAIPSPTEGMMSYVQDIDSLQVYSSTTSGSALGWRNVRSSATTSTSIAVGASTGWEIINTSGKYNGTNWSFYIQIRRTGATIPLGSSGFLTGSPLVIAVVTDTNFLSADVVPMISTGSNYGVIGFYSGGDMVITHGFAGLPTNSTLGLTATGWKL